MVGPAMISPIAETAQAASRFQRRSHLIGDKAPGHQADAPGNIGDHRQPADRHVISDADRFDDLRNEEQYPQASIAICSLETKRGNWAAVMPDCGAGTVAGLTADILCRLAAQ